MRLPKPTTEYICLTQPIIPFGSVYIVLGVPANRNKNCPEAGIKMKLWDVLAPYPDRSTPRLHCQGKYNEFD